MIVGAASEALECATEVASLALGLNLFAFFLCLVSLRCSSYDRAFLRYTEHTSHRTAFGVSFVKTASEATSGASFEALVVVSGGRASKFCNSFTCVFKDHILNIYNVAFINEMHIREPQIAQLRA